MYLCSDGHGEVAHEGNHCPACAEIAERDDQIRDLEKEVEELKETIDDLRDNIDTLKSERDDQ